MLARETDQAGAIQLAVQTDRRMGDGLVEPGLERRTDAGETVAGGLFENLLALRLRIEEDIGRAQAEARPQVRSMRRRVGDKLTGAVGETDGLHVEAASQEAGAQASKFAMVSVPWLATMLHSSRNSARSVRQAITQASRGLPVQFSEATGSVMLLPKRMMALLAPFPGIQGTLAGVLFVRNGAT